MYNLPLPLNLPVEFVSRVDTLATRTKTLAYELALLIVTVAAVVVGTIGYAYTAFRLWQEDNTASVQSSPALKVVVGFVDFAEQVYKLGARARAVVS